MDPTVLAAIISSSFAFAEATIALVWHFFTKSKFTKMEQAHAKEMEELKKNNSKEIIKYENDETRADDYEKQRYEAITNYLESAATFLSDVHSDDGFSDFSKSISKIFMYLPEKYHGNVKKFNDDLRYIERVKYENNFEKLTYYISEAEKLHSTLSEDFSIFGLKPPTPPQE